MNALGGRHHLTKIAEDYVCPEKESAEFAFAYIPSESTYWFLVTERYDLLRDFTKKGVQVVSPLTLSYKRSRYNGYTMPSIHQLLNT